MIHNPYAKKRPRPSGWSSSSSSLSTSAPVVVQQSASSSTNDTDHDSFALQDRNSQIGRRYDGPLYHKENATNQVSDGYNRFSENKNKGIPNEFEPSEHRTKDNLENVSRTYATTKAITAISSMTTCHPSQKMQPNLYTKNLAKAFPQNDIGASVKRTSSMASTANRTSRKVICNPYMRKNTTTGTLVSVPTAKSATTPLENIAHRPLRKVNSNPCASLSIGTNSNRSVPEKQVSTSSVPNSSDFSHTESSRPEPKVASYLVGSVATIKTVSTSKSLTKLPSGMASIRPASWKSTNDCLDNKSHSLVDLSGSASVDAQQKPGTQSSTKNITGETFGQHHAGKTETAIDRLPPEISYTSDEVKPIQDEYRMLLIKNAKLSSPLKNGWLLFPHQKKAIIRGLTMRRMILALDMGLGKTLIGAVWSKAFKDTFGQDKLKVFVICPVTLKQEWKRTAEGIVGLDVDEEGKSKPKSKKSTKKKRSKEDRSISELSKESIAEKPQTHMNMSICSWAKVPKVVESNVEHFVVCCDEAHAMQSTQSQRTKDILNLVDDRRCAGVLLLTGTPMKNGKPSNIFPLLKAVRHPLGRHQKAFEAHFCNGMLKNFGRGAQWDATGASNLDLLKRKVSSNLLHMTKEQCLTELPPMTTIFHDVPVSIRYQVQYEHSIKYLASVQANSSNMRDEAVLGAVQRLRVVCAHAKIEATVEMARTVLNKEPAVVIFTFFAQVAKNVHSKLETSGWPCSLLTGETPQKKRQELVDNFQNGLSSVFVSTFGAGGVGLTLTAASTIILLDRPWTPGETRQAEDRIRRIGQLKKCTSYWMRSFDLDKQIDGMLESKNETTNAVLDKSQKQKISSGPSAKISINQLVHKFVLSETMKKL